MFLRFLKKEMDRSTPPEDSRPMVPPLRPMAPPLAVALAVVCHRLGLGGGSGGSLALAAW
jgi:hypothetical protein